MDLPRFGVNLIWSYPDLEFTDLELPRFGVTPIWSFGVTPIWSYPNKNIG